MSEMDDIFDIEYFIEQHSKKNDSIRKTWESHKGWHTSCENAYIELQKLKDAIDTIKRCMESNNGI